MKKLKVVRKFVLVLLSIIFLIDTILFYKIGIGGFHVTLTFYSLIFISSTFINKNTLKINILIILLFIFSIELYLRLSNKNLSYSESNSGSIFTPYTSRSYGQNNSLINGLKINEPNKSIYSSKIEFNYEHKYNEYGFRELSFSNYRNKPNNIVVLGDSYTEGVGAPFDSTGIMSIQNHLSNNGFKYNVINCGVSGSDLIYAYKLLDTLYKTLRPKVILYNLDYSDIDDIIFRGGQERFKNVIRKAYWWEFIYSFSFIFRNFANGQNINPNNKEQSDYEFAWNTIQNTLNDFNNFCIKNNIIFVTILTPGPSEIYHLNQQFQLNTNWNGNLKYVLEYNKKENNIKYIDTQEKIYNIINADTNFYKYYYELDYHFRPLGYWHWGKIVSDDLVKYLN